MRSAPEVGPKEVGRVGTEFTLFLGELEIGKREGEDHNAPWFGLT